MLVPANFLGYLDRSGAGRAVRSCLLEILQKLDKRRYKGGRKLYLMVQVIGLENRDCVFFFDDLENRRSTAVRNGSDESWLNHKCPFSVS